MFPSCGRLALVLQTRSRVNGQNINTVFPSLPFFREQTTDALLYSEKASFLPTNTKCVCVWLHELKQIFTVTWKKSADV